MWGPGTQFTGTADTANNLLLPSAEPGFVNRTTFDYHLLSTSPAIDKGGNFDSAQGFSLIPAFEFLSLDASKARTVRGALDLGAFEFNSGSPVIKKNKTSPARNKYAALSNNSRRGKSVYMPVFRMNINPSVNSAEERGLLINGLGQAFP